MNFSRLSLAILLVGSSFCFAMEQSGVTDAKLQGYVDSAIAYLKLVGTEEAFKEFNKKNGEFANNWTYIWAYDQYGNNLAHGEHPEFVVRKGNIIRDLGEVGKKIMQKKIDAVKDYGKGWAEYVIDGRL